MTEDQALDALLELDRTADDTEMFHRDCEAVLLEYLKTNGAKELAIYYKKLSQNFWYA